MQSTIAALLIFVTPVAFAADHLAFEQEVLELVIAQSAAITVVDSETGDALPANQQLPAVIAQQLSFGYLSEKRSGVIVLGDTSVRCENTTPKGLLGASSYLCRISFQNGDFGVSKDGSRLNGPQLESSMIVTVEVTRVVYPGSKPKLKSTKATAVFAG
jgi:hypothetical protein